MSNNVFCRRCGHELTAQDFADGFCSVCGEPAAAAEETAAAGVQTPDVEPGQPGPDRVEWQADGDYVVCPLCQASYFADAAPEQCEQCAQEPQYAQTRWEKPSADLPVSIQLVHRSSQQQIPLSDGLRLGRLHTDCLKDDRYISRLHATVLVREGSVLVRDEGSSNGTRVNGEKLTPQKAHLLKPGDVLMLDEQIFDVCAPEER